MYGKVICDMLNYNAKGELMLYPHMGHLTQEQNQKIAVYNENRKALDYLYQSGVLADISSYFFVEQSNQSLHAEKSVCCVFAVRKIESYKYELLEKFPENTIFADLKPCEATGCITVTQPMGFHARKTPNGNTYESWEIPLIQLFSAEHIATLETIQAAYGSSFAGLASLQLCFTYIVELLRNNAVNELQDICAEI